MPIWKKRSGIGFREDMQIGVLGEIGGQADDVGARFASSTRAWPNGAARVG
jgi:hypothetical protein